MREQNGGLRGQTAIFQPYLKVHLWEKGKNFMNKEKNIRWIPVLCFGVLMLGLGSSDSLRGIFSPVFQEHYGVGGRGLSMMVVISYVGNLLFLSVGGKMMDTFDRKRWPWECWESGWRRFY